MIKEYNENMNFNQIIQYLRDGQKGYLLKPITINVPTITHMVRRLQIYKQKYQKYKKTALKTLQNARGNKNVPEIETLQSTLQKIQVGAARGLNPKECGALGSVVQFYNKNVQKISQQYQKIVVEEKDNKVRFWEKLDKIINNRQHENAQEKIDAKNIQALQKENQKLRSQLQSITKLEKQNTALNHENQNLKLKYNEEVLNTRNWMKKYHELNQEAAMERQDRSSRNIRQLKDLKQKTERYESSIVTLKKQLEKQKEKNDNQPSKKDIELKQCKAKLDNSIKYANDLEKSNHQLKEECQKLKQLLQQQSKLFKDDPQLQKKILSEQDKLQKLQSLQEDAKIQLDKLNSQIKMLRAYSQKITSLHEEVTRQMGLKK